MIVRAQVVVTMDEAPIIDGAVRVDGKRIVEIGSGLSAGNEHIVQLDSCVLLPGLINAHCHLDYTCLRGRIPPLACFTDWIRAINAEKAQLTADDYLRSIAEGFCEAQRFGTTSMVNLEAFPELIARAEPTPLRTWWCPELIDVSAPERTKEIVSAALQALSIQNNNGGSGLAPHALFTASPQLFRRCQQVAAAGDLLLTTHLAESREEMEMFHDRSGPLFEFLRGFGRDMSDCGGTTPIERLLNIIGDSSTPIAFAAQNDRGDCWSRWVVAHLNEVTENDFHLLAKMPLKFSIAHCPRSHAYFGHSPFAFERLRELGFNICLATDSLASNSDLSLFSEMREFQTAHPKLTAEQILEMVTLNPARVLGRAAELGKIAPSYFADLIALPISGSADVPEQIIAFRQEVPWMMIDGEVI